LSPFDYILNDNSLAGIRLPAHEICFMTKNNIKQPDLTLKTRAKLSNVLIDRRLRSFGVVFGTLEAVARQYGVRIEDNGDYRICFAPKNRLQLFAEKLHFACVRFSA